MLKQSSRVVENRPPFNRKSGLNGWIGGIHARSGQFTPDMTVGSSQIGLTSIADCNSTQPQHLD